MKNEVPVPKNATDSEILDWYLHSMRLASSSSSLASTVPATSVGMDIRGVSLSNDLVEFLSKFSSLAPAADELKNPFEYWAFVESVFFPSLRSSLIPEPGSFASPQSVEEGRNISSQQDSFPHYSWAWALEDCVDTSLLSDEEKDKINSILKSPLDSTCQVTSDLLYSLNAVDEATRTAGTGLLKLRKWIKELEKSDFTKLRNSSLQSLLLFAESLLQRLQKEQMLDGIEELHRCGDSQIAVVIDDIEKVKCFLLPLHEAADVLLQRDSSLESPQTESVQFSFPFTIRAGLIPRLPQLGPYCHICRQAKSNLARCTQRISSFFNSADSKDLKCLCPRKFCIDCLVAYNWPKPGESGKHEYKCPICAKLCTCDRCVRNVFLRVIRSFVSGLRGAPVALDVQLSDTAKPVESVFEFLNLIGEFSAFSITNQSTPESPVAVVSEQTAQGRVRRLSSVKKNPEDPGGRKRSKPNSVKSETFAEEMSEALPNSNEETPDSARKKRRAAANIDSFYKS